MLTCRSSSRTGVPPRCAESAPRQLQSEEVLDRVLTLCERRTLSKNLTLSYSNLIYQIQTKRAAYTPRNAQVEIRETGSGEITIAYKGGPLDYTIYRAQEQHQAKVVSSKLLQPTAARAAGQPKQKRGPVLRSHTWRSFEFTNSLQAKELRGELCILRK